MIGSSGSSRADQDAGDVGAAAAFGQPEEGPRAFAETLDQAAFGQKPQMAGQPRLRLAQNVGEVGDGQFGLRKQRQNAQPGRFARGFQRSGQFGESSVVRSSLHQSGLARAGDTANSI